MAGVKIAPDSPGIADPEPTLAGNEIDLENFEKSFENPFLSSDGTLRPDAPDDDAGDVFPSEGQSKVGAGKSPQEPGEEPQEPVAEEEESESVNEEAEGEDSAFDPESIFGTEEKKKKNKGLREQLKDRNDTVSQLQRQVEEREAELEKLREQQRELAQERDAVREKLQSQFNVGEYNESADPEVRELTTKMGQQLREAEVVLGPELGKRFSGNFEQLLIGYQNAVAGKNQEQFHELLDTHFPDQVPQVTQQLARLNQLVDQREQKVAENRHQHYSKVISNYERRRQQISQELDQVGAAKDVTPDRTMELNSLITFAVKGDSQYASEVEQVKRSVAALTSGVRPFDIRDEKWKPYVDPSNPGRLTPRGEELRAQEVEQWQKAQEDLPRRLTESWAASLLVPRLVKKLSELQARLGSDQEDESVEPEMQTQGADGKPAAVSFDPDLLDDPDRLGGDLASMGF